MVLRTRIRGSSAPRRRRRVRNPMMLLSKITPLPLRFLSAIIVEKMATSRTVRSSRSGELRKVMST